MLLKQTKKAFSIVLAMILVIIMLFVAYNLLDMIIPFAKNTKGIENASNSYYKAYGGVEEAIYNVMKNGIGYETSKSMANTATGYSFSLQASGTIIPISGKGNSEFNKDWNIVGQGEPVQLYFLGGTAINWALVKFYFRVPDLDLNGTNSETLSGTLGNILNWQLSGSGNTLNASGSSDMFQVADINGTARDIGNKYGIDLDGNNLRFSNFYTTNLASCASQKCSLKLSVVNELFTRANQKIPYLEYKIDFGSSKVPEQYVEIKAEGKSYGFKKSINLKYRVDTTSEAFDFTVFQ